MYLHTIETWTPFWFSFNCLTVRELLSFRSEEWMKISRLATPSRSSLFQGQIDLREYQEHYTGLKNVNSITSREHTLTSNARHFTPARDCRVLSKASSTSVRPWAMCGPLVPWKQGRGSLLLFPQRPKCLCPSQTFSRDTMKRERFCISTATIFRWENISTTQHFFRTVYEAACISKHFHVSLLEKQWPYLPQVVAALDERVHMGKNGCLIQQPTMLWHLSMHDTHLKGNQNNKARKALKHNKLQSQDAEALFNITAGTWSKTASLVADWWAGYLLA